MRLHLIDQILRPLRGKLALSLVIAAIAVAIASTSRAQTSSFLPDFSATEVTFVRGREITSKVYLSGVNFRAEPRPGLALIYLTGSHKLYRMMSHGTGCFKMAGVAPHQVISPLQLLLGVKVQRTPSGNEVIDGHSCKVENVEVTAADGKTSRLKLWEETELKGVPVKIEAHTPGGEFSTTYRDIVVGTPDAALFIPPNNCVPFEKTYEIAPPGK
jgi:hypothetical protein